MRERERANLQSHAAAGKSNVEEEGKVFSGERQTWRSSKEETTCVV
jgi:hypothetical protein